MAEEAIVQNPAVHEYRNIHMRSLVWKEMSKMEYMLKYNIFDTSSA
jgi:hypothetical protein